MSWWDPIADYFSGDTGGSGLWGALGDTVSNAGTALGALGNDAMSGVQSFGQSLGAPTGPVGGTGFSDADAIASMGGNAEQVGAIQNAPGLDMTGGYSDANAIKDMGGNIEQVDAARKAASSKPGLSGFLDKYGSDMKAGLGALTDKTTPAPSTQQQQGQLDASNAQKAAVGTSMINQAPFVAQNSMNTAKIAGDAGKTAAMQTLSRQGYGPGSAQAQSLGEQYDTDNSKSTGTAYAAGQTAGNTQAQAGATLATPTLDKTLGTQQNAQQTADNKNKNALLNVGVDSIGTYANT